MLVKRHTLHLDEASHNRQEVTTMVCSTRFSRRIAIGLVALTLTAGGILLQPTAALAGFGTSPASAGLALRCSSGEHLPDATLVSRKAGGGQQEY